MASDLTSRLGGARSTLGMKAPCRACATTNVTLSGTQTVDGVALVADDRVLVAGQTLTYENGIYIVRSTAWVRARDWDASDDFTTGTHIPVHSGTSNSGIWQLTTTGAMTLGVTGLAFSKTFGGTMLSGNNLSDVDDPTVAFNNISPTTTRGDLIARGATDNQRVALGTAGYALISNGTDPVWTGFEQTGTGAATRTWTAKLAESALSVTDFGCVLDGVTDDTVNYQKAIDQAVSSGRPLYHPPGTAILDFVTITGSLIVFGAGPTSVAKRKASSSGGMFRVSGTGNDVAFTRMMFDANYANQAAQALNYDIVSQADGSNATRSDTHRLSVVDCEFRNSSYSCVRSQGDLDGATREVLTVERCVFRGGADGVENVSNDYIPRDVDLVDGVEAWVDANYFHSDSAPTKGRCAVVNAMTNVASAIYSDIHITNNRITYRGCNVSEALGAIDVYIWGNNCVISGNVIKSSLYSPIKWKQNAAQTTVAFNKIDTVVGTNFPIIDCNEPTYGPIANGCLVIGNQVTGCDCGTSYVVALGGVFSGTYAEGLVVSGNHIINCSGAAAIYVSSSKNVTVENNVVAGSGTLTIALNLAGTNTGLFVVRHNRVDQTTTNYSLYLDNNDASFDVLVLGNVFAGSSVTYAMYLEGRRVVADGNVVNGGVAGILVSVCTDAVVANCSLFGLSSAGIDVQGAVTNMTLRSNTALGVTTPFALTTSPTNLYESDNSWGPARQTITAASSAVTNTVTATKFDQSITIPANRLRVGMIIRIKAQGIATATNSTDTLATTLFIGGTGGTFLVGCSAADVADGNIFWMEYDLTVRAIGASGSIVGIGAAKPSPGGEAVTSDNAAYKDNFLPATTINTTTTQEVCVTAQWSVASTSNSCRLDVLTVEYIY